MLNVQELSARLSMMADPALQQYASLHKDDPYVLALAVSESNRRRQVRAAQQGVAGMQPQPTVAEQEVAQMNAPAMPENVGIGALAAPNMQMPGGGITGEEEQAPAMMAGGGMVAFAGGGDVERYQVGGGIAGVPSWMQFMYSGESPVERARRERLQAAAEADAKARSQGALEESRMRNMAEVANAPIPIDPNFRRAVPDPRAAGITYGDDSAPAAAAAPGAATTTGQQPPTPPRAPVAGAAPGTKPAIPAGGLGDLQSLYARTLAAQTYTDPAAAQLKALEAKELAATQAEKAALERDQAKFAEAFKGRETRLGERAAEIGKQKDINTGLAFLNAGLAVMSTPGGLAMALGKGAQVGTQQFAAGLDKIRSAQEKLDEARDRMEELKLNRDEMSAKEIRAAESKIRQVGIDAEKRGIDGLRQAGQINRDTAKEVFGKTVQLQATREEIAGRLQAAKISAGAPSAQMQMAAALGGGSTPEQLQKGMQLMNEAATGKTDMRTLYTKYLADKEKNLSSEVMTFSQFLGQFAIPTSPGNNPAAAPGTVRERP